MAQKWKCLANDKETQMCYTVIVQKCRETRHRFRKTVPRLSCISPYSQNNCSFTWISAARCPGNHSACACNPESVLMVVVHCRLLLQHHRVIHVINRVHRPSLLSVFSYYSRYKSNKEGHKLDFFRT